MNNPEPKGERSIALFLLGILLFNPPMLAIFGAGGNLAGVPLIYIYLFVAWAVFILLMGVIAEYGEERRRGRRVPQLPGDEEGGEATAVSPESLPHRIDPVSNLPSDAISGAPDPAVVPDPAGVTKSGGDRRPC